MIFSESEVVLKLLGVFTIKKCEPQKGINYEPFAQSEIAPKVNLDHTVNELIKVEGSEKSCTYDGNADEETITFQEGDSFDWDVNILRSDKDISYTKMKRMEKGGSTACKAGDPPV